MGAWELVRVPVNAVPRNALCGRVSCEPGLISRVARLASYGIGYHCVTSKISLRKNVTKRQENVTFWPRLGKMCAYTALFSHFSARKRTPVTQCMPVTTDAIARTLQCSIPGSLVL